MDECLNAQEDEIRDSQTKEYRLLDVLRPMVQNTRDESIHYLKGTNLGFGAKKVDCLKIQSDDDGLIDYGPDIGFKFLNDTNNLSSTRRNSIIVPLKNVCGDRDVSHVFFTIYRHQKLFNGPQRYRVYGGEEAQQVVDNDTSTGKAIPLAPPGKCETQISVPSQASVLSATVMDSDGTVRALTTNAKSPVIAKLQFNLGKTKRPLHGETIVSWFNTDHQMWDLDEQCTVTSNENGIISANCEHLTDFSALILGQISANYVCSYPLIMLGYVVNGVSTLCLLVLTAIGILFYVIMMSMLIGIRMISPFLIPKLRRFFTTMTSPPAAISIGLLVPLAFTVLIFIFDIEFFKRDDEFCWVRPDYVVYAVLIPMVLPTINGVICSSFAIYKMFFQARRGLADGDTKHHDAEFWSKVLGLIFMQVAMGLPWVNFKQPLNPVADVMQTLKAATPVKQILKRLQMLRRS
uniref:GPS domain-containing protein n=2 Tax=Caenorhabditis japonica TaxID=281687 RepID=A0A8R1EMC9_CAEJA